MFCFNDDRSLTQLACRSLYQQSASLVSGRDHGSHADQKHLQAVIKAPHVMVWYDTADEWRIEVKLRMLAQLKQLANVISDTKGILVVDLGHNDGFSGEAGHPWNTLNTVLDYHQILACNLGVSFCI